MATSRHEDTILCPLTLEPIPSSNLDVGVVYASATPLPDGGPCGHRCTLFPLVQYVQGGDTSSAGSAAKVSVRDDDIEVKKHLTGGGMPSCPICQASPIMSICDGTVASALSSVSLMEKLDIVCFRHAKQNYWLSVPGKNDSKGTWLWKKRPVTAQQRIGQVLGMNSSGGLKVLYKGKVLHPDPTCSPEDVSHRLVELSETVVRKNSGKPSLVVMGTRAGLEVRHTPGSSSPTTYGGGLVGLFYWGFNFLFQTIRGILGGFVLFAKTLLILPSSEERRED